MSASTGPSGSQPVAQSILDGRRRAVADALVVQANKTTFAIGGSVHPHEHSSVAIRYDTIAQVNHCRKVSFPVEHNDPNSEAGFSKFLEDTERASFGRGGEAVFDETYRKAGKMAAERFATNFNLSEWGIVEAVSRALVHSKNHGRIKAELYNVNVYSAPSGKFKLHVDTPRSKDQVGSLVICLPCSHEGGQLAVRHQGREVIFDWGAQSSSNPPVVQWAAFFSDCEHEVLQVTAGHRVTLTYNLYWTPPMTEQMAEVLEPEQLAFFPAPRDLLSHPDFLPRGGCVGFTCAHAYPHRSSAMATTLHHNLKGIDMLVYQALKHLTGPNGKVNATDVVDDTYFGHQLQVDEELDSRPAVGRIPLHGPFLARDEFELHLPDIAFQDFRGNMYIRTESYEKRRHASGWHRKDAYWLNRHPDDEQENRELAAAYLSFGNEPSLEGFYSAAVIIAHIDRT